MKRWSILLICIILVVNLDQVQADVSGNQIVALDWNPDSSEVAIGMLDGTVQIINTVTQSVSSIIPVISGDQSTVVRIAWSHDGTMIARSTEENSLVIWDLASQQVLREITFQASVDIVALAWHNDNRRIAAINQLGGAVYVWDVLTGEEILLFEVVSQYELRDVVWDSNDLLIVYANGISRIDIQGNFIEDIGLHNGYINSINLDLNNQKLAAGDMKSKILIWDVNSLQQIAELDGHTIWVRKVHWHPNGIWLASAGHDMTIRIWNVEQETLLHTINEAGVIFDAKWSPDGTKLAYVGDLGDPNNPVILVNTSDIMDLDAVSSFTQLPADQPLSDGATINLEPSLTIRADTVPATVGSVVFSDGTTTITDNTAPYEFPISSAGSYTLTATPYSAADGGGTAGTPLTVNFTVVEGGAQAVTGFTLIDADNDVPLFAINDGDIIDLAALPTLNLSIDAATSPSAVGSVIFGWDGDPNVRTETDIPYAIAGNNGSDYNAWTPKLGAHEVVATPYTEGYGNGDAGTALTVDFTVIDSSLGDAVISYSLIDVANGVVIDEMYDGYIIDYGVLGTNQFDIRATVYEDAQNPVNSVVFGLDGEANTRTESVEPYELFGGSGSTLATGAHTLITTPYDSGAGGGTAGVAHEIAFLVYDPSDCPVVANTTTDLINAINTATSGDTICLVQDAVYTLTSVAESDGVGDNGLPIVDTDITIIGNGATIQRSDTTPDFRFFKVASGSQLALQNLTLKNGSSGTQHGGAIYADGDLELGFVTLENNQTAGSGGALFVSHATVTITSSVFSSNINTVGSGGAIFVWGDTSNVAINHSTFESNSAAGAGGALFVDSTNGETIIDIQYSSFESNSAVTNGGAIRSQDVHLTISDSDFVDNFTTGVDYSHGGAINGYTNTEATIINTTFTGNQAPDSAVSTNSDGGAIYISGAETDFTIIGGTFTQNQAPDDGGAIMLASSATLDIQDTHFVNNSTKGSSFSDGGAIFNTGGSNLQISNVSFVNNHTNNSASYSDGGALVNEGTGTTLVLEGGTFTGNGAADDGGAITNRSGADLAIQGAASTFTGNYTDDDGGALLNDGGALDIADAVFDGNYTTGTGYNDGGAIFNISTNVVTISNTSFLNNRASDNSTLARGGAIANDASNTLQIVGGIFDTNSSSLHGGAIFNANSASLEIQSGTLFQNHTITSDGGVIWNFNGASATISNATFSNNTAQDGGAIRIDGDGSSMLIQDTVFDGNQSTQDGGAIITYNAITLTIQSSEFTNNSAVQYGGALRVVNSATVNITTSCLSGNTGTNQAVWVHTDTLSPVIAQGNWWGASTGPTHSGNPSGTGETVADNVDYANWVDTSSCDPMYVGVGSGMMTASAPTQPELAIAQPDLTVSEPESSLQEGSTSDLTILPSNRPIITTPLLDTFDENTTIGWRVTNSWELSLAALPQFVAYRADVGQFGGEFILESVPAITLNSQPTLTFMQKGALAAGEVITVEVQVNGTSDWVVVDTQDGLDSGWQQRQVDLSTYADQTIAIRFRIQSPVRDEETITNATYWLDDVAVD